MYIHTTKRCQVHGTGEAGFLFRTRTTRRQHGHCGSRATDDELRWDGATLRELAVWGSCL